MKTDKLLEEFKLSSTITLKNRIIMAPLTRCFADDDLAVTELIADYYQRRADTGLIISEATIVTPSGQGYPNTPGIYSDKQIKQWKLVTEKVHQSGGKIFCQLWHVGRVSHPTYLGGDLPVAPSAVELKGKVSRTEFEYGMPRALENKEVYDMIKLFKEAALNAIEAGFDGVEIHGANGYLFDQFMHQHTNLRTDEFGGSLEGRAKFTLDIVDQVIEAVGADKVGIRLSPGAYVHQEHTKGDEETYAYILNKLNDKGIAYVHTGIFDDTVHFDYLGGTSTSFLRKHFRGNVIASGSYTTESAVEAITRNDFDLIAVGRSIIANPDYVKKIKNNENLTEYDAAMLGELY
ncbi:MAG: 2,4-dienoyl-CoA reductase-like NADH-dependent reductase (Old Yellow Enzyme family) [Bacteriovoracaceae bacterium]|jgi:N-ethylmaleimide reductase